MRLSLVLGRNEQQNRVPASGAVDRGTTQSTPSGNQGLHVGDQITGKIVSKDGQTLQIDLGGNRVLQARMDQNIPLSRGQTVSFEVKSGSDGQVSLSPLFTNMTDAGTAVSALSASGLPADVRNMQMVSTMISEKMPISREQLLSMTSQLASLGTDEISDGVRLVKLGLDVDSEHVTQLRNYLNYEHQIDDAVHEIVSHIPDIMDELSGSGEVSGAVAMEYDLLNEITDGLAERFADAEDPTIEDVLDQSMRTELAELLTAAGASEELTTPVADGTAHLGEVLQSVRDLLLDEFPELAKEMEGEILDAEADEKAAAETSDVSLPEEVELLQEEKGPLDDTVLRQDHMAGTDQSADAQGAKQPITAETPGTAADAVKTEDASLVKTSDAADKSAVLLSDDRSEDMVRLLKSNSFQELLKESLSSLWKLTPEQVAKDHQVTDFYDKISAQAEKILAGVSKHMEPGSALESSVSELRQNLNFMSDLNQIYPYVQLPMKMSGNDAHGDLYVYTNKKNLARKDGTVSALLHLDMEHLGPMDVYVSMNSGNHVNTHFYLPDEESLDLIAQHIDLLNERLEKRGYSLQAEYTNRGETQNVMKEMLGSSGDTKMIRMTSFDARA